MTTKDYVMPTTEKKCREFTVPYFETIEELTEFISKLDSLNNDYGTSAYAMTLAATAAFNHIASKFGCTGFQASCADLDIIRRTRMMTGPFMIVDLNNHLYPQYNILEKVSNFIEQSKDWIREQAIKNLLESPDAHPNVIAHWKKLAK